MPVKAMAAAAMLTAALAFGGEAPVRWLNLHVSEARQQTEVSLHLPMPLVTGVLQAVDSSRVRHGRLCVDHDDEMDWAAALDQLRRAPDGADITIKGRRSDAVLHKRGDVVLIDADERSGEHIRITVRASLLDGLSIERNGTIDLDALVRGLDGSATGDLLTVSGSDTNVRMWVE